MKALRYVVAVVILVLIAVALWVGSRSKSGQIAVGGKNFTEQTIIGEMAAQLIEHHTGLRVRRKFNLATNLPMKMLTAGEIDVYLDYTGTGYVDILGHSYNQEPPEKIYEFLKETYPKEFGAAWLTPLGFKNTYTLTMRAEHARELGIESISDLAGHAGVLKAAFDPAFLDREDGYPGLSKFYGFEFAPKPGQLAIGLMYKACAEGQVDVIDAFSTDGRIARFNLKILDDDKRFFPPYDAAFVARQDTLREHPGVRAALEMLAGRLDNQKMQELNYAVDEGGRTEANVAREFLLSEGLITQENEDAESGADSRQ
ncbi:MAG TPA: glycine betaine ABC transporter substrate-binding protein [Planctomycetota bacterium]|nr:glycine betaine ABC transporter substrate-binding protein [Planctomycetota bacterium]